MFSWFFPFCSEECFPDSSPFAFFSWVINNGFPICYCDPLPPISACIYLIETDVTDDWRMFSCSSFVGWSLIDLNIMPKTPISAFDESDLEF